MYLLNFTKLKKMVHYYIVWSFQILPLCLLAKRQLALPDPHLITLATPDEREFVFLNNFGRNSESHP